MVTFFVGGIEVFLPLYQ